MKADVDNERVMYIHDGSSASAQVEFYFGVTDGKHPTEHRHFRIVVVPLELRLVNISRYLCSFDFIMVQCSIDLCFLRVTIEQGHSVAYMDSSHLGAETNGRRGNTKYNVTRGPVGGQIHVSDAGPASVFTQLNVDNREVAFVQTDMSLANDSFVCSIINQVQ